jgi:hypothetical protein
MVDQCVIKDTPDAKTCGEPRYTTVSIAYTFSYPESGSFLFDLDMCKDHSAALKHRVEQDLPQNLKRKA